MSWAGHEVAELEETVRAQNALIVKLSAGQFQVHPAPPFLEGVRSLNHMTNLCLSF